MGRGMPASVPGLDPKPWRRRGSHTHREGDQLRATWGWLFNSPQFKQGFAHASHVRPGKILLGQALPVRWLDSVCAWAWLGDPDLRDCPSTRNMPRGCGEEVFSAEAV